MLRRSAILLSVLAVIAVAAQGALAADPVPVDPTPVNPMPGDATPVKPKPNKPGRKPGKPGRKPGKNKPAKPASVTAKPTSVTTITTTDPSGGFAMTPTSPAKPEPDVDLEVSSNAGVCMVDLYVANLTPRRTYTVVYTTSADFYSNVRVMVFADASGQLWDSRPLGSAATWGSGRTVSVVVIGATTSVVASENSC